MRVVSEEDYEKVRELKAQEDLKKVNQSKSQHLLNFKFAVANNSKIEKINSVMKAMDLLHLNQRWDAWNILQSLLDSNNFSWNEDGNITYLGETDQFSKISFLLKSLINKKREFFQLPGTELFQKAISNESHKIICKKIKKFLSVKPNIKTFVHVPKRLNK